MGKATRWKPPHPAKTIGTPADVHRSIEQGMRERDATPANFCTWRDCQYSPAPELQGLPICIHHARLVTQRVTKIDGEHATNAAAEIVETRERIEADIDNGIRINRDLGVPGWIYYIQVDDTIKIGYAKNVANRMRAYPPSAKLLAVEPGTKKLEAARHGHFHYCLAHGREWFRIEGDLTTWIEELRAEYGAPDHMAYTYRTPEDKRGRPVPRLRNNRNRAI